ncbi:MAG: Lrp/AsnC family transcriptional regulator [Gammaproteobacteria bacterium]|nr:Lrp/AsnC family transcriptional regulator [Gammaproteobacteria bacterium]
MDIKDKKLISLLLENARASTSDLARRMGLSRTAVQERIKKLEARGIITGYTIKLSSEMENKVLTSHVTVQIDPKTENEVIQQIKTIPSANSLYTISGEFDLIVILRAESTTELDSALSQLINIDGVNRTKTSIILSTKFER